jgi:predicted PurR-regulated permease PerM
MPSESSHTFVARTLIVIGIAALVVVLGLVSWMAASVLLTLFAGLLVGVLLRGTGQWLSGRTGLPYLPSLAVVCVALGIAALGFSVFLAASVAQQFSELYDQLPGAWEQLRTRLAANPLGQRLLDSMPQSEGGSAQTAAQVVGVAAAALGALGNVVLVMFVGLFLAADPLVYRRGLIRLVPRDRRARADEVFDEVAQVLLKWLAGRLLLMTIIGVLTWIGLLFIGVPLALGLGIIAGALSFIPNIGPIISAVPAMLIAATVEPVMALYVAALYLGLQTAESYLLEPYVVRRTADLPAAMVIGFQVVMGTLAGVLGLMMATPLLAVIGLLVQRLYVEDVLGDTDADGKVNETGGEHSGDPSRPDYR